MRRFLLIACAIAGPLAFGTPNSRAAREESPFGPAADRKSLGAVKQLIADLGSDEYARRRRAEEQLIRLGPAAFDELKLAENHRDLEIAERVRYIVQQVRVEWTRIDDPLAVRRLLAGYDKLSQVDRSKCIGQLAALTGGAGTAALCRIARFEPSPLVARRAAVAVLEQDLSSNARRELAMAVDRELGDSRRTTANWIRLFLRESEHPAESIIEWVEPIEAEATLLSEGSTETEFAVVQRLVQRHLEQCRQANLPDETTAALVRVSELIANQLDRCRQVHEGDRTAETLYALVRWGVDYQQANASVAGLLWALEWVVRHERWDVLERFAGRFGEEIRSNRKLLYFLAAATARAGRGDSARELAERAYTMTADDDDQRIDIAEDVASLGFVDWAEREYQRAIETFPLIDVRSMEARSDLAMWLHDREDFQGAADLLGKFCDAIDGDRNAKQGLLQELDGLGSGGRDVLNGVIARREFYLACAEESRGDYRQQRMRLARAAAAYDKDPDILIAMYRVKGADDDYRQNTRTRIRRSTRYMQALIDEYPDEHPYKPTCYNQWAWLVANTEGDQQKAVEYSRRSLELAPGEPSYLDTLARCYFAVGDLENAVDNQRKAVQLAPQYRIMRRQLAAFERALAERSPTAEAPGPSDEKPTSDGDGERPSQPAGAAQDVSR